MFRPLRRTKNAISNDAAKELLVKEKRAVFSVNGDDGYPFSIPVNFIYDEKNNKIYFHGAKSGHKVDSLKKNNKVCFTVYGNEFYKKNDWAPYLQSTVVFGRCKLVDDSKLTEDKIRELALKYYPSRDLVEAGLAKNLKDAQLYEITIEHICGKQIHEK